MDPARVTIFLLPEDIEAFAKFTFGKRGRFLKAFGLIVAILIGALLVTPSFHIPEEGVQILYLAPIGLVGLAMFFHYGGVPRRARRAAEKEQHRRKPTQYEVRDEGLFYEDELQQGTLRWPMFRRLVRDGAYIYLFISTESGLIFPVRCFPTGEDAAIFFNQILQHLEKMRAAAR